MGCNQMAADSECRMRKGKSVRPLRRLKLARTEDECRMWSCRCEFIRPEVLTRIFLPDRFGGLDWSPCAVMRTATFKPSRNRRYFVNDAFERVDNKRKGVVPRSARNLRHDCISFKISILGGKDRSKLVLLHLQFLKRLIKG